MQYNDPFAVAFEEQKESPPESPTGPTFEENEGQTQAPIDIVGDEVGPSVYPSNPSIGTGEEIGNRTSGENVKTREDDDEEEEENIEAEIVKLPSGGDPNKVAKMHTILSQFTEDQMNRYESFRRSAFQKANMNRLLMNITGSSKISQHVKIVVGGIAKMFVGELVEIARVVMMERKDRGPIRPCHIREAYRRLKLEGKVPRRSVPRLFR